MPDVRVAKIDDVLPLADGVPRSTAPADLDRAIAAAPYCWAGSAVVGGAWNYGARRDVEAARLMAARPSAKEWRHLFSVRVDLAYDDGGGCNVPWEYLKRLPRKLVLDALRVWSDAGYTVVWTDWVQRAMGHLGRDTHLAYYAVPGEEDGRRVLRLTGCGIDLGNPNARVWAAMEMERHLVAARTVYGTPTDPLVGIKSGALATPGWRLDPAQPAESPRYLLGGFWSLEQLGTYYRDVFARLGRQSIVTNEAPEGFERGALWGASVPDAVIGDGVFV